jgi:hypothetical protein
MTEDPDEIRNIGDIPENEADELREMIGKVFDSHIDEFVLAVYNDLHRPLSSTAYYARLEEIPQEVYDTLVDEGMAAFLSSREIDQVDEDELRAYTMKYVHVARSVYYPWLLARRKGAP